MSKPVFHYTLHRRLWDLLSDNPDKSKKEVLKEHFSQEEIKEFGKHYCTACEYAEEVTYMEEKYAENPVCNNCPLNYPVYDKSSCLGGLYEIYSTANDALALINKMVDIDAMEGEDFDTLTNLESLIVNTAMNIRNLPVREGVEYD